MRRSLLLSCAISLCTLLRAVAAADIYVDDALTTGANDGTTWADAYRDSTGLQSALADAAINGGADTIHIAEGVYKPGSSGASRDTSFVVPLSTTIIGSYDAGGVAGPDTSSFPTRLSGDRLGDDNGTYANADDNFYHVVVVSDADNVSLRTLIVEAGTADSSGQDSHGGGILIETPHEAGDDTVVILIDCVVLDCFAYSGAGIAVVDEDAEKEATLIAHRSDLFNNLASLDGGTLGGGIVSLGGIVDLSRCWFEDNQAATGGGALAADGGEVKMQLCTIQSNETASGSDGGGVYVDGADLRLFNCKFCDNTAIGGDGGALLVQDADLKVKSTTFAHNTANNGGAVYIGGSGTHTIVNSILWDDAASSNPEIALNGASVTVTHTDVEGGYAGTGNVNVDPEFIDGGACNLHLEASSDVIDEGVDTSAAADILDHDEDANTTEALPDLDIERRVLPCAIDMGAYEYDSCPWDIAPEQGDGTVGNGDLTQLLINWGACEEECCPGDTIGYVSPGGADETGDVPDGVVGSGDLSDLLIHWGSCSGESLGGGGEIEDEEELAALLQECEADGFTQGEIDAIWELLESWGF